MILLCLLHRLFCLYAPEVLYGLVLVFARMLGLRAESVWMCRSCTFMLLENIIFGGIFSHIGWTVLTLFAGVLLSSLPAEEEIGC
jgi:hypothetical protein